MLCLFVALNTYSAPLSVNEKHHGSETAECRHWDGQKAKLNLFLAERSTSYGGL